MATRDTMELREDDIRAHYLAATEMLMGVDHTPRIASPRMAVTTPEKSPGVAAMGRRFRSTTPGLVTRSTARAEGVRLLDRIAEKDEDDPLTTPVQAAVGQGLRRALAIALALGDEYARTTPLTELKKANLENRIAAERRGEFTELLAAQALAVLYTFGNATAFLLSPQATERAVDLGMVEEVLTDNAPLALHGALWELDQMIAAHATDDGSLVATVLAYAELLMAKVAQRAENATRLAGYVGASWRVEADDLTIAGFKPARAARGTALTMTFKKPHEVVGNHIAKYQSLRLSKMLMAYEFDRKL
ncbi:MAG: AAA family ATPase, partial [Pseudorhodobacter sp.]